jgi:hypothetical protein
MIAAHDTICGALRRALYLVSDPKNVAALHTMFARFELAYSAHASEEATLLRELDVRLDLDQRAALSALIADR